MAYSLSESSAATRLAEGQEPDEEVFFLLGRRSPHAFVRERQVIANVALLTSLLTRAADHLLRSILRIPKGEVFSLGPLRALPRMLVAIAVRFHRIDVVHWHWGGLGFVPFSSLEASETPIVVTTHDYNPLTGGCHVPMDCPGLLQCCTSCPLAGTPMGRRYVRLARRQATNALASTNAVVVSPSEYASQLVRATVPGRSAVVVPNSLGAAYVDTAKGIADAKAAYIHRVSADERAHVILVSVVASQRQNKGHDVALRALEVIQDRLGKSWILTTVGCELPDGFAGELRHVPAASNRELIALYSSADLCLVPSRYETFSQVTAESIACLTPVVAFDLTGPRDIIMPGVTGFLVPAFDICNYASTALNALAHKRKNLDVIAGEAEGVRKRYQQREIARLHRAVYQTAMGR